MYNESGKIKVIAVDLGIKYNQIRCLIEQDCKVQVVPWDFDFIKPSQNKGEFLSVQLSIY